MESHAVYDMPIQTSNTNESVYLFNKNTGEVILSQNAQLQRHIASTTKLMTALLVLESGADLNALVTVPESLTAELTSIRSNNGVRMGLAVGEQISRLDLMYALLVHSYNDAASVLACDIAGSIDAFVERMNARAAQLGLTCTHFSCPHGLYDDGNWSTAAELAEIAKLCRANETYMQIANTVSYTTAPTNMHPNGFHMTTTNRLINPDSEYYRAYTQGMKTGFTTRSGRCFVTYAEENGVAYGLVILGAVREAKYIYDESVRILDWAVTAKPGETQDEIDIEKSIDSFWKWLVG